MYQNKTVRVIINGSKRTGRFKNIYGGVGRGRAKRNPWRWRRRHDRLQKEARLKETWFYLPNEGETIEETTNIKWQRPKGKISDRDDWRYQLKRQRNPPSPQETKKHHPPLPLLLPSSPSSSYHGHVDIVPKEKEKENEREKEKEDHREEEEDADEPSTATLKPIILHNVWLKDAKVLLPHQNFFYCVEGA